MFGMLGSVEKYPKIVWPWSEQGGVWLQLASNIRPTTPNSRNIRQIGWTLARVWLGFFVTKNGLAQPVQLVEYIYAQHEVLYILILSHPIQFSHILLVFEVRT